MCAWSAATLGSLAHEQASAASNRLTRLDVPRRMNGKTNDLLRRASLAERALSRDLAYTNEGRVVRDLITELRRTARENTRLAKIVEAQSASNEKRAELLIRANDAMTKPVKSTLGQALGEARAMIGELVTELRLATIPNRKSG